MQHVDALHDDKCLQHVHLELKRLHAEVVEVGEGGREELPQDVGLLGGAFLQPALGKVKPRSQTDFRLDFFFNIKMSLKTHFFVSCKSSYWWSIYGIILIHIHFQAIFFNNEKTIPKCLNQMHSLFSWLR